MQNLILLGDRFICNIAQPENSPGGLFLVNRDPRKQRLPPDAYVGVVEETGPDCRWIRQGDRIVVRRWIYRQHDLDDERIVARESQVLICADEEPAPGVVVLKLKDEVPVTSVIIPDTIKDKKKRPSAYTGTVLKSGIRDIKRDWILWVERRDRGQYFLNSETFVFRDEPDQFNGESAILMKGEPIPVFEVV